LTDACFSSSVKTISPISIALLFWRKRTPAPQGAAGEVEECGGQQIEGTLRALEAGRFDSDAFERNFGSSAVEGYLGRLGH
jgi:hypothetical protein